MRVDQAVLHARVVDRHPENPADPLAAQVDGRARRKVLAGTASTTGPARRR